MQLPPTMPGQNNPQANTPIPHTGAPGGPPAQMHAPAPVGGPTKPSRFDAAIPGQSLTDTPKNAAWEHPPQYTSVHDALNYIFDQLLQPVNFQQTMMFLDKGLTVEHLVKMILFTGFTTGHWTPDLALMMVRPLTSIIAGLAHRAGLKHAKMTDQDRSGFKHLYKLSKMNNLSSSNPVPPTTSTAKASLKGLMAPRG